MAINANGSTFFRGLHNTPFTIEEISKVGVISDQLQTKYKMESKSVKDRSVACILGVMFGDILGAAVEGFDPELVKNYRSAPHMGVWHLGPRFGTYTDDTNSTLALASSIAENSGLNAAHAAKQYGIFWQQNQPLRGYPPTAQKVMKAVLGDMDFRKTGGIAFPEGSFANGGAMRISPVGLAFRNASDDELLFAVKEAIVSSHIHPEAIDGAFIQAKAISVLLKSNSETLDIDLFLNNLLNLSKNDEVRKCIKLAIDNYKNEEFGVDNVSAKLFKSEFQIKTSDALGCVLWSFAKFYKEPEQCVINTASMGGDTDTIASMVGGLVGALHGTSWLPLRWFDLTENGQWGRDFAISTALKLADLDLKKPIESK